MILVVDSETSDLLKADLPLGDAAQPWIVSLAAQLCTPEGLVRDFFHIRIRADGRQVRTGAQAVHGISTREAARHGVSEVTAFGMLIGFAAQASYAVGHGIDSFDRRVVESGLIRLGKDTRMWTRAGLQFIDTMLVAAPVCKIPSGRDDGQFKWPSLDEACQSILDEAPREGAHSAYDDCDRARRLFLALRERNCVEIAA